jgi:dihydroneopterin aldolase
MAIIELINIEFYAYHGHFKEEQIVGNKFIVNVKVETDINKPAETDNLKDALDYTKIYKVVEQEMMIKSNLLENVLLRIVKSLFNTFSQIEWLEVSIKKVNPPIGTKVDGVALIWRGNKNNLNY